jgi:hypothetical protein
MIAAALYLDTDKESITIFRAKTWHLSVSCIMSALYHGPRQLYKNFFSNQIQKYNEKKICTQHHDLLECIRGNLHAHLLLPTE